MRDESADYVVGEDAAEWEAVLVLGGDEFAFGGCFWCEFDDGSFWVVDGEGCVAVGFRTLSQKSPKA